MTDLERLRRFAHEQEQKKIAEETAREKAKIQGAVRLAQEHLPIWAAVIDREMRKNPREGCAFFGYEIVQRGVLAFLNMGYDTTRWKKGVQGPWIDLDAVFETSVEEYVKELTRLLGEPFWVSQGTYEHDWGEYYNGVYTVFTETNSNFSVHWSGRR